MLDNGTVTRLDDQTFRWRAAEPNLRWFRQHAAGLDVRIDDVWEEVAPLALQGPTSAALLRQVAHADIPSLKYFRMTRGTIAGAKVDISRTGYTGDLGYELWINRGDATKVWDALAAHGPAYGLKPAGMLALDVARIEAGLLLIDVDFFSARKALTASQMARSCQASRADAHPDHPPRPARLVCRAGIRPGGDRGPLLGMTSPKCRPWLADGPRQASAC